ncbi:MAG: LapA family protein [Synergistaceae bacterium]|nr:LapA family protein [Synergistaceae bacterium]
MKSNILGIMVAMILSAVYVLSNTAEITVKFLSLEMTFHQGLWEIIVFGTGVLIMGLISFCAEIEMYVKNRKKTKELTKRVAQLEDERKSLLDTLRNFGWKDRGKDEPHDSPEHNPIHEEARSDAKTVHEPHYRQASEPPREPEEKIILDKQELPDGAEPQKVGEAKPPFLKTLISSVFKREKKTETAQDVTAVVSDETDAQAASSENVCSIPEPDEEECDVQAVTETEDKEKSEI